VREWLEQQTVAGILEVEDEKLGANERRFRLPPGHAEPLIDCSSLNYMVPLAQLFVGATHPLPALLDAYRNGGGVPYEDYGNDLREGQAAINYPAFFHQLPDEWLPAMPDVHARLQADPPARIADIDAVMAGRASECEKPRVYVDGYDLDEPSIERARQNARTNGAADRVHFYARDAGDPALTGEYDLVTAFECVHDMSNPIEALRVMRRLAGAVPLIVDKRVGDTLPRKAMMSSDDVRLSILHCLPVGMTGQPG
jgi:hypothetical protein